MAAAPSTALVTPTATARFDARARSNASRTPVVNVWRSPAGRRTPAVGRCRSVAASRGPPGLDGAEQATAEHHSRPDEHHGDINVEARPGSNRRVAQREDDAGHTATAPASSAAAAATGTSPKASPSPVTAWQSESAEHHLVRLAATEMASDGLADGDDGGDASATAKTRAPMAVVATPP